jgi:hypothetical protein
VAKVSAANGASPFGTLREHLVQRRYTGQAGLDLVVDGVMKSHRVPSRSGSLSRRARRPLSDQPATGPTPHTTCPDGDDPAGRGTGHVLRGRSPLRHIGVPSGGREIAALSLVYRGNVEASKMD